MALSSANTPQAINYTNPLVKRMRGKLPNSWDNARKSWTLLSPSNRRKKKIRSEDSHREDREVTLIKKALEIFLYWLVSLLVGNVYSFPVIIY